jgi:hypothetical protein
MRSVVSPPSTIGVEEESLLLDPETRAPGSPAQAPWCVARARWKLFGPTGETLRRIRFHQRRTAFSFGHDWPKSSACSSNTCSAPSAAHRASSTALLLGSRCSRTNWRSTPERDSRLRSSNLRAKSVASSRTWSASASLPASKSAAPSRVRSAVRAGSSGGRSEAARSSNALAAGRSPR